MTNHAGGFKRMVVSLPQSIANEAAVNAAADLAEFLHIEFLAAFPTDESLTALAGYPLARELRSLEQGWRKIDPAQITQDLERAVSMARRSFADVIRRRAINARFDVFPVGQMATSLLQADDIVAIIEPSHPGERITRQFTGLLQAALDTAGAVLMLPRRIARRIGPVIAVVSGPDDTNARIALNIAAALKEELVVVTGPGEILAADLVAETRRLGVHVEQIVYGGLTADAFALGLTASRPMERLRVVGRSQVPDDAARLFAMLHEIPLLVVEPERIRSAGAPARQAR